MTPITVVRGMERIYGDDVALYPNVPRADGFIVAWTVELVFRRDRAGEKPDALQIHAWRAWRDRLGRLHTSRHRREVAAAFPSEPIDALRTGVGTLDQLMRNRAVRMVDSEVENSPWHP